MSTVFVEDQLRFEFGDEWFVLKWDAELAYRLGVGKLDTTKAVDFAGRHLSHTWLLEVKDFRRHRIENKERVEGRTLVREIAEKVRDTLASLVWARDREHDGERLSPLVAPLFGEKVKVVLWMENDRPLTLGEASTFAAEIKQQLRWLSPKVLVVSTALGSATDVPDLVVTHVPHGRT